MLTDSSEQSLVCVVGLGKIGLPLAVQCARSEGITVLGCDINSSVVASVNAGSAPFVQEEGLEDALREVVTTGRLKATTDTTDAVRRADVILVIVPVGLTDGLETDFSNIDAACIALGAGLQRGALVIFETTVPVGTTRNRLGHLIESVSDLEAGKDYALAFSPERVYSGRIFRDLAAYPKVIGAIDPAAAERGASFYRRILTAPVRIVSSIEAAEYVKLVETTYRDVNIALANEFALYAETQGIDVQEVIEIANTQPFSHVHQPSVGVGGHCIPVYPYFLFSGWNEFRIPPMARAINDGMAAHAVDLLEEALGTLDGARVLILGLTYRENVKEVAFTSARKLSRELRHRDAVVYGHDPLLTETEQRTLKVQPVSLTPPPAVDAIILQANHDTYHALDYRAFPDLRVVLDGRSALSSQYTHELALGAIHYLRIGLGSKQAHTPQPA